MTGRVRAGRPTRTIVRAFGEAEARAAELLSHAADVHLHLSRVLTALSQLGKDEAFMALLREEELDRLPVRLLRRLQHEPGQHT